MQRLLSTTALLGLLIATAAAFAITEHLKLVKSPIFGTIVSKTLSPVCSCARGKANISFKLRKADAVTLTIVGPGGGGEVATVTDGELVPAGRSIFRWDGKTDAGERAPDGIYHAQVHLAGQHRTIRLPNEIRLDTHPPRVFRAQANRQTFSPDGDGQADSVRIRARFDSRARVRVYLGSKPLIRGRSKQATQTVTWYGRTAEAPKPLPAGTYTLYVGGVDLAGNVTPAGARLPVVVRIRYIRLARDEIVVHKPGVRFGVRIDTDAKVYWWKLAGKGGVAVEDVLRLRAPAKPGTYRLSVGANGHAYRAKLVVERPKAAP